MQRLFSFLAGIGICLVTGVFYAFTISSPSAPTVFRAEVTSQSTSLSDYPIDFVEDKIDGVITGSSKYWAIWIDELQKCNLQLDTHAGRLSIKGVDKKFCEPRSNITN